MEGPTWQKYKSLRVKIKNKNFWDENENENDSNLKGNNLILAKKKIPLVGKKISILLAL